MRIELNGMQLGMPGLVLLGMLDYTQARQPLNTHVHHDILEICCLARGRQIYLLDGVEYALNGGDIFVSYPGQPHGTGQNPEEKSLLYWVQLDMRPCQDFLGLPPEEGAEVHQCLTSMTRHHFRGLTVLHDPLTDILALCQEQPPFFRARLRGRLLEFLAGVWMSEKQHVAVDISREMKKAVEYIVQHPSEWPSLAELADLCGLSLPRFKVRFRAETGMPPGEYIARIKVAEGIRQLKHSASITETAHALGFSSSQYMATVFKRITGKPPSFFR
jgi:AraC-like DNA-binding protein